MIGGSPTSETAPHCRPKRGIPGRIEAHSWGPGKDIPEDPGASIPRRQTTEAPNPDDGFGSLVAREWEGVRAAFHSAHNADSEASDGTWLAESV